MPKQISATAIHYIYLQAYRYAYPSVERCLDTAIRYYMKKHTGTHNLFLTQEDTTASFEEIKSCYIRYAQEKYIREKSSNKYANDAMHQFIVCKDRRVTPEQLTLAANNESAHNESN